MKRSLFITFEGGDGAGKTTLIDHIASRLSSEGYSLIKTREPGGTPLGEKVRDLLLEPGLVSPYAELCLFLASRAQHIAEVIRPALQEEKIVLCDRFNDSTIAYQGAARQLGVEKVADFCAFITEHLEPHLTIYLDLDPHIGKARIQRSKDRIEGEDLSFHHTIRDAFHTIAKRHPKRFKIVDASQPPAKVFADAMELVYPLLEDGHVRKDLRP